MADELHHIFELFDPSKFVAAFELAGKDVTVTIDRVAGETIEGEANRKAKKPVIHFRDWPKPLVLNKTNAKVLIQLYGADYRTWKGKRFTMYPTTTKMAGDEVDAIRLRKRVPSGPAPAEPKQDVPPRSLAERTMEAIAKLAEKNTEAGVSAVWKAAETLRADLEKAEDGALLDKLTAAKDARLLELRMG